MHNAQQIMEIFLLKSNAGGRLYICMYVCVAFVQLSLSSLWPAEFVCK